MFDQEFFNCPNTSVDMNSGMNWEATLKEIFLKPLRKKIAELYFYFGSGFQYLSLINFALLVIATSDKLKNFIGIEIDTVFLVVFGIPACFLVLIFWGWFFDCVLGFQKLNYKLKEERMPTLSGIDKKIDKLLER